MKHKLASKLLAFLMLAGLNANNINDISKDISLKTKQLQTNLVQKNNINLKLNSLGSSINSKLKQIKELDYEMKILSNNILENKKRNDEEKKNLEKLQKNLNKLNVDSFLLKEELAKILLQNLVFSTIIENNDINTIDDIILQESFKVINKKSVAKIKNISSKQKKIKASIETLNANIKRVSNIISLQENKALNLEKLINSQKNLLANMQSEITTYNNQLKQIDTERQSLDKILTNLNILKKNKQEEIKKQQERQRLAKLEKERLEKLKKQEEQRAKEQKQRRLEQERLLQKQKDEEKKLAIKKEQELQNKMEQISKQASSTPVAPLNVKQMATSYQEVSTIKYKGSKTIAPIKSYIVEQGYGTYYDPVYKLKVFNEGVILKAKKKDSVVHSVLDGKVIYAKDMPMLKKVVIIESSNNLYVIYSQLDKIAPTLKDGFIIKKGYVIGRVNDKLSFEVRQDDNHINPLDMIAKSSN